MKRVAVGVIVVLTVTPVAAWESAARAICEPLGVPLPLVRAIVAVESGGDLYVVNARIGEVWRVYRSENEAVARLLLDAILAHSDHVDVGLMQVNVKYWARDLQIAPLDLIAIERNLLAGCTILSRVLRGPGPLWQRIGRYHSPTPARHPTYAEKGLRQALFIVGRGRGVTE